MKISDAFKKGKELSSVKPDNSKAFIAFITCGDPDLETTEKLIYALQRAGADLIELGIPFSDPTAEGPVIQAANERALSGGVTTDKILDMVSRVRDRVKIPLAFMTYANVVFSYGTECFLKAAAKAGVNGIILPDVPFEEKGEFADACEETGLDFVSLIAPTSSRRVEMIAKEARGFVYCVSSLGVTGVRSSITADISGMVEDVRRVSDIPVAVGFGISTPEQASHMASLSDGVIIGSAIVRLVALHGRDAESAVYEYAKGISDAVKGV